MLEIEDKTIYGKKSREDFTLPFKGIITLSSPSGGSSTNMGEVASNITIPLVKTAAKPTHYIFRIIPAITIASFSASSGGTDIFSYFGPIQNLAYARTGGSGYRNYANFMTSVSTTTDSTFAYSWRVHSSGANTGTYNMVMGFNDYEIHDKASKPSNVTIRLNTLTSNTITSALADPVTGFDSYGTELSGAQYDLVKDMSTELTYETATNLLRTTIAIRLDNVDKLSKTKYVVPVINAIATARYLNTTATRTLDIFVWNFDTNAWDQLTTTSVATSSSGTWGSTVTTGIQLPEIYSKKDFEKYMNNGTVYYALQPNVINSSNTSHSGGLKLRYVGLLKINGKVWE